MTAAPAATDPSGTAALAGILAALATATMWSAWVVATRFGVAGTLTPVEVALLGEIPDLLTWFGIAAVVSGVALASGLARMLRPAP